ncbi:hypothetical protein LCGC14_1767400 [marine sediment metagenome]|uniref:Uncharacterized protein n=1 Tax=marine sediment metagenome TaxID=412755 RepID=A0A0F9GZ99_9ZZZZ
MSKLKRATMTEREKSASDFREMRKRSVYLSGNQHLMGLNEPIRHKKHWYSLLVSYSCSDCGVRLDGKELRSYQAYVPDYWYLKCPKCDYEYSIERRSYETCFLG